MATTISDHIPASVRYGVNKPSTPRATPMWLSVTRNSGSMELQLIRAIRAVMAAVNYNKKKNSTRISDRIRIDIYE